MAGRRLPALCGGGRAATTRVRRKRAACSSSPVSKLAVAALASGAGNKASSKGGSPGGVVGGCYVDGNGALMVEVGGAGANRSVAISESIIAAAIYIYSWVCFFVSCVKCSPAIASRPVQWHN